MPARTNGFTFALGSLVLPDPEAQPVPVVWRGQLKERHPATGLVQRVPVYRLGDGHWSRKTGRKTDCTKLLPFCKARHDI